MKQAPIPSASRTSRSNRTRTKTALTGLLLLALTACGGPEYDPVPEEKLSAEIKALPGVTNEKLDSYDSASQGTGYQSDIYINDQADPVMVLDQATAILWQGLPEARINVSVIEKDGREIRTSDVGLIVSDDFEARYGPQPGSGEPPTDKPSLELKR